MEKSKEQKQWDEYCKNKINTKDETFSIIYDDYGENKQILYHIVGYADIRGDKSFVLYNEWGDGMLEWIPEQYLEPSLKQNIQDLEDLRNKGILNITPMLDITSYFARMEFNWISKYMKDIIEEYWNDSCMDEIIQMENE